MEVSYLILLLTAIITDWAARYVPHKVCSADISRNCSGCRRSFDISVLLERKSCLDCGKKVYNSIPVATVTVIFLLVLRIFTKDLFFDELLNPAGLGLVILMLSATAFDIKFRLIPNKIVAAAVLLALAGMFAGLLPVQESLIASTSVALVLMLIRWASTQFTGKAGIGVGDVKLIVVSALFMGWDIFWITYAGFFMGGLVAVAGLWSGSLNRDSRLPMAPFLLTATFLVFFIEPAAIFFS